ncbi:reductive dehalogenase [candidate division KSB1 bacterium]|nr:reductive dehalogenase [candidate division KSB1 bacterium]
MTFLMVVFGFFLIIFLIGGLFFLHSTVKEHCFSAFFRGLILLCPLFSGGICLTFFDYPFKFSILIGLTITFFIGIILINIPSAPEKLKIPGTQHRIDERDALFHRFYRIQPGTPEFEAYYKSHPEKYKIDAKIRAKPQLCAINSKSYHPLISPFQLALFEVLEGITREIEWLPAPLANEPVSVSPEMITPRLKEMAAYLGADLVGTTRLNKAYIYSHIGRSPGKWGEPITLNHEYAIAIAVEMRHEMVQQAPDNPTMTETGFQYFEAAKIAMILARYINFLGYEARAHLDANYQVMCIPIAVDAGLGELGRLGLLITPQFGPRVRLSIVTTNLPLVPDSPINFGVQDFCSFCKKCAIYCPSGSISKREKKISAGVEKWQSEQENCYHFWRTQGTDCGICLEVCPYSYPNSMAHHAVRWLVRRNHFARKLAYWGDKFFYAKAQKNWSTI